MYKVYVLPKEKYCGVTKRDLSKRLWEHKNICNRDIVDAYIVAQFENKQEALEEQAKKKFNSIGKRKYNVLITE